MRDSTEVFQNEVPLFKLSHQFCVLLFRYFGRLGHQPSHLAVRMTYKCVLVFAVYIQNKIRRRKDLKEAHTPFGIGFFVRHLSNRVINLNFSIKGPITKAVGCEDLVVV